MCVYVEPKRISSESKHSPRDKETSRKKAIKVSKEYHKNIKNINKKQNVKIL